ncbi:hypothetical protein EDD36DRAFT_3920 [Exophiala viscosa]|uniref:C2H2 type master regulator of conidiophore development brlA n=1 Tax=Exophiala viscosa TaxID=2486360 RepID=A0AAN6E3N4_9EURO|nr:hypothetical protein EDD36DRAFT_3920 [Exophiala viscosa]
MTKHVCNICGVRLSRSTKLREHMRIHTKEKPFRCDHSPCGKSFSRSYDLTKHRGIHTGSLTYHVCAFEQSQRPWGCGKRYRWKKDLNRHLRSSGAQCRQASPLSSGSIQQEGTDTMDGIYVSGSERGEQVRLSAELSPPSSPQDAIRAWACIGQQYSASGVNMSFIETGDHKDDGRSSSSTEDYSSEGRHSHPDNNLSPLETAVQMDSPSWLAFEQDMQTSAQSSNKQSQSSSQQTVSDQEVACDRNDMQRHQQKAATLETLVSVQGKEPSALCHLRNESFTALGQQVEIFRPHSGSARQDNRTSKESQIIMRKWESQQTLESAPSPIPEKPAPYSGRLHLELEWDPLGSLVDCGQVDPWLKWIDSTDRRGLSEFLRDYEEPFGAANNLAKTRSDGAYDQILLSQTSEVIHSPGLSSSAGNPAWVRSSGVGI